MDNVPLDIPRVDFSDHRLENGLRVILQRNEHVPLVHVTVHYRVGSSYERPGLSGFAHLFEHMMFQGSSSLDKNEHGRLVDEAGGRWNASTSKDRTNYYQTLPSHFLELGLWLEADRMRSLEVTEENFENQRQTVIEEKKQSYDNQPYGLAFLRFDELAYENWAYGHPIIGSVEDLEKAGLEDARAFHERFYGPGNAILVIAGDFAPEEALTLARKHFETIDDRTKPVDPDLSEPTQTEAKLEVMTDPLAQLPAVSVGFHMPELGSEEYYALNLLSLILADGDSSRLYRRFVYDNNWVTGLYAGPNQYRGPGLFRFWFQLQPDVSAEELLKALDEELERLCQSPIEIAELEKGRNQVAYRQVSRLSRVSRIGENLAQYACLLDAPEAINDQLFQYFSLSAERIREVASTVFRLENRTTLLVEPQSRIQ